MRRPVIHTLFVIALVAVATACEATANLSRKASYVQTPIAAPQAVVKATIPYDSDKEFFVAPNGKSARAGSKKKPWDLQTVLSHPPSVEPGSTVWLRGGVYVGRFTSNLRGSAKAPIVLRQYPGERATIDGAAVEGNVLTINGAYTWYVGFEVTNSNPAARAGDGITLADATSVKLINLVVHDNAGNGIGAWSQSSDIEIYGCLSFLNGRKPGPNHAYGLYGQNKAGEKTIAESIFIQNFGNYPIHIYGSEAAALDNFCLSGNVFYGGWVLIGGHAVAQNPIVDTNFFYGDHADNGIFDLGWQTDFGPGANNAVVTNNYFMGGKVSCNAKNTNTTMFGNTFYGRIAFDESQYPDNTYYISDFPSQPARPSGPMIFVRPNKYEQGRGNLIVYNWDRSKKLAIDLSRILRNGDQFEIRDAEDFLGAAAESGVYDGGAVHLKMNRWAVTRPVSVPRDRTAPVHTTSEFNVFVVSLVAN